MIWDIASSVVAAISLVFAVITYLIDRHNKKKADTIQAIDRIFDSYYELARGKDINKDYHDYVKFLSIVERFATDVNERVLIKKIVKTRLSIFLANEYQNHLKELIIQRRKQFSREGYYEQIEKLIRDI